MTIAAANALIFFATESLVSYGILHFLDAFSSGFGMPVIAVAEMRSFTHGHRLSVGQDAHFFVMAAAGTIALVATGSAQSVLP